MKNIHIIERPSIEILGVSPYGKDEDVYQVECLLASRNVFITSDDEPKDNDWVYYENGSLKGTHKIVDGQRPKTMILKKIIMSTDSKLIKDGIPTISEEFLKWFIKNLKCESVEVESYCSYGDDCPSEGAYDKQYLCNIVYRINVPEETLVVEDMLYEDSNSYELAKNLFTEIYGYAPEIISGNQQHEVIVAALQKGIVYGATWQADRGYTDAKVIELLERALTHEDDGEIGSLVTAQGKIRTANFFSWFEKFKNK